MGPGARVLTREQPETADLIERLIARPLHAEEVADILGVTKPTVMSWLRAGLLVEAPGSKPTRRLFDTVAVIAARNVLRDTKLQGTLEDRASKLAELPETLYWSTHPTERSILDEAIAAADRSETAPYLHKRIDTLCHRQTTARSK